MQMNNEVVKFLTGLSDYSKLSMENIQILENKIITYKIIENNIFLCVSLLLCLFIIVVSIKIYKAHQLIKITRENNFFYGINEIGIYCKTKTFMLQCMILILAICCLIGVVYNTIEVTQDFVFPEKQ